MASTLPQRHELSDIYERDSAFKKLARLSISSDISVDTTDLDKEVESGENLQDRISKTSTAATSVEREHSRRSSADSTADKKAPKQQAPRTPSQTNNSSGLSGGFSSFRKKLTQGPLLYDDSLMTSNDSLPLSSKTHSRRGSTAGSSKGPDSIHNKGEIVSFYARKQPLARESPLALSRRQSASSTVTSQTAASTTSKKQSKEQVIMLETSDPDFFYSLSARDKFGRMFEMSELKDKVVLVKLDQKAAEAAAASAAATSTMHTPYASFPMGDASTINESFVTTASPSARNSVYGTTDSQLPASTEAPVEASTVTTISTLHSKQATEVSAVTGTTLSTTDDAAIQQRIMTFPKKESPEYFYSITVPTKFNKPYEMSQLKGKVVLIVNTASKCKMAKQFSELQTIYEQYHDQGLEILAFPTGQFGFEQELKSDKEILQFCKFNYGVEFPIFKKIRVNGKDEEMLYTYLKHFKRKYFGLKSITWNFEKFLISRDGHIVKRVPSFYKPKRLVPTIEKLLQQ